MTVQFFVLRPPSRVSVSTVVVVPRTITKGLGSVGDVGTGPTV